MVNSSDVVSESKANVLFRVFHTTLVLFHSQTSELWLKIMLLFVHVYCFQVMK